MKKTFILLTVGLALLTTSQQSRADSCHDQCQADNTQCENACVRAFGKSNDFDSQLHDCEEVCSSAFQRCNQICDARENSSAPPTGYR